MFFAKYKFIKFLKNCNIKIIKIGHFPSDALQVLHIDTCFQPVKNTISYLKKNQFFLKKMYS